MDPRYEASRGRLREALLELAAAQDVDTITVAALARAAGVDRGTVYAHAASPSALLALILHDELDALRVRVDELIDAAPHHLGDEAHELNAHLIDHAERYAAVYADHTPGRANPALAATLTAHVEADLREVFARMDAFGDDRDHHAAFVAHGIVGALAHWLRSPAPGAAAPNHDAPRERGSVERVLALTYTHWLLPAAARIEDAATSGAPATGPEAAREPEQEGELP